MPCGGSGSAAHAAGQQLLVLAANSEEEIEAAFMRMVQDGASALLVMADPVFTSRRQQITALAARHKIPAIYDQRDIAAAGGLMSYVYCGPVLRHPTGLFRRLTLDRPPRSDQAGIDRLAPGLGYDSHAGRRARFRCSAWRTRRARLAALRPYRRYSPTIGSP